MRRGARLGNELLLLKQRCDAVVRPLRRVTDLHARIGHVARDAIHREVAIRSRDREVLVADRQIVDTIFALRRTTLGEFGISYETGRNEVRVRSRLGELLEVEPRTGPTD